MQQFNKNAFYMNGVTYHSKPCSNLKSWNRI